MLANVLSPSPEAPPKSQLQPKDTNTVVLRMTTTTVFYEAVANALDSEQVVWDVGCGSGLGSALLRKEGRKVVGIDPNATSVADASNDSLELCFVTDVESATTHGEPDVIVIADVLGYVSDPASMLLKLARLSKPSTQLLVFEPRANVTQQLPLGKKRAYSALELLEQTAIGGWSNPVQHDHLCQTFVVQTAERSTPEVLEALAAGVALVLPDRPLGSAATHLTAATRAMSEKNGELAIQSLLGALQISPNNTHALCGLARFAQSNGSQHEALHLLRQGLTLDPTNLQAMELWLELVAANAPQDLLQTCQALSNLSPSNLEVLTLLAQLHAESGQVELAIQDLELIRKQQPKPSADLSITLAWLLHSAGRNADAQVEARLASILDPENPDVVELLGALAA